MTHTKTQTTCIHNDCTHLDSCNLSCNSSVDVGLNDVRPNKSGALLSSLRRDAPPSANNGMSIVESLERLFLLNTSFWSRQMTGVVLQKCSTAPCPFQHFQHPPHSEASVGFASSVL